MMITFSELTKQVHLVKDLILSDMICGSIEKETKDESANVSKNLFQMKSWFIRISWANKKRYILALLEDVRSAWTLSCLLKSIWNCQPKDAVISSHQPTAWSSYDSIPLDYNRTALPVNILAQVMKNGRYWFLSLEPQIQAKVLLELLSLSGGPIMCIVLKRCEAIYQKYRTEQLQNLKEFIVCDSSQAIDKGNRSNQNMTSAFKVSSSDWKPKSGEAEKELELNLIHWNNTLLEMRKSLKLDEIEMTFKDGTKRKIWKVNRPKPEALETVDYIQLLPSEIAKKILSYLPSRQLGDYVRVNKYWAYLIQDYHVELSTKAQLKNSFEKLEKLMLAHDISLDFVTPLNPLLKPASTCVTSIHLPSSKMRQVQAMSTKASEKSTGAYSFRHLVFDNLTKPILTLRPLPNVAELSNRLKRRGAADENLWDWCNNIIKDQKHRKAKRPAYGVFPQNTANFPHSKINETLEIPLKLPLIKDPVTLTECCYKRNISNTTLIGLPRNPTTKRYKLWTKDFSGLFPIYKIPSHAFNFHN